MTVYAATAEIDGVTVHVSSRIKSWDGWPDDVREIIRAWNKDKRLRFDYIGTFKCMDCERFVSATGSTAARFDHALHCDDCLIDRARKFGPRGRRETELEKAKRWQRNMGRKLAKYRHNAIQEREYVAALMAEADGAASVAHDFIYGLNGVTQAQANAAVWTIHHALRPYIEKNA